MPASTVVRALNAPGCSQGCSAGCGRSFTVAAVTLAPNPARREANLPARPCAMTAVAAGSMGLGLRRQLASLFHRSNPDEVPCCQPTRGMIVQTAPAPVLPPVQPAAPVQSAAPIQPVSTAPVRPAMKIAVALKDRARP